MVDKAFRWEPDSPLQRYWQSVLDGQAWLWAALAMAVLLVLFDRFRFFRGAARVAASRGVWILPAVLGLYRAYELGWLSDDAFISFRYARNWAMGNGLVYNVGERVEGYTNFLWTAIMAVVIRLGLGAERWSIILSMASLVGAVGLTTTLLQRMSPKLHPPIVSVASVMLAVSYTFASYGTSGLETMAATFLVLLAVERADSEAYGMAGMAGIGAVMMHPDHVLFYVALGAALALSARERRRNLVRYAAPLVLIFIPYYLARWHYYGDFFPNTYYAKSGGAAYFSQGATYLWISGLAAGAVFVLPFTAWGIFLFRHHLIARFTLFAVPLYLAYVAKIGGDFMLGRLLCPALPFTFLMAEVGARRLLGRMSQWPVALAGFFALALAAVPNGVIKANEKYMNLADERTFYKLKSFEPVEVDVNYTQEAKELMKVFARAPQKPLLGIGCIGIVGWLTDLPIMDNWGLANRSVAHMPIRSRGRPGHEKLATPGHAFEQGVDFSDISIWPAPYEEWTQFDIGGFGFSLAKFDEPLATALTRTPSARAPNIEDRARRFDTTGRDPARLDCDHWFFEQIYFARRRNDALRKVMVDKWTAARPELTGVRDLLFGPPAASDPHWKARTLFSFDDLKGWEVSGDAFSDDPSAHEIVGQGHVAGATGPFANSAHRQSFDKATGSLVSPPFVIEGDAITLRVGGGIKPDRVFVRLRVDDGLVVASATGCESEVLGRRIWPVAAYRGRRAVLEIADNGSDGWAHIVVDDVEEWTHEPE